MMPWVTVCESPGRAADGKHHVADPQPVRPADRRNGQVLEVDVQDREVRIRIAPHDGGIRDALVGELHPDGVGVRDDVMVGHDVPVVVDDDPGAQRVLDALSVARPVFAQQLPREVGATRSCTTRAVYKFTTAGPPAGRHPRT